MKVTDHETVLKWNNTKTKVGYSVGIRRKTIYPTLYIPSLSKHLPLAYGLSMLKSTCAKKEMIHTYAEPTLRKLPESLTVREVINIQMAVAQVRSVCVCVLLNGTVQVNLSVAIESYCEEVWVFRVERIRKSANYCPGKLDISCSIPWNTTIVKLLGSQVPAVDHDVE